ncbi:hypothetical protein LCGC14_0361930 [marine sediment metagenome]|uniref:Uncharacterized protein n=1 Tax=marine sediment metagenome TaxID=412755 RepID=A0A0F9T7M6_9ZZZZ
MLVYKCDAGLCDETCGESEMVTLKGYTGQSGGILLPKRFQEKHFCDAKCFEDWLILEAQVCKTEICAARGTVITNAN